MHGEARDDLAARRLPFLRRFGTGHKSQVKGTACSRLQTEQKLRGEKEERGPLERLSFAAQ
jgi:hypothetical protein